MEVELGNIIANQIDKNYIIYFTCVDYIENKLVS